MLRIFEIFLKNLLLNQPLKKVETYITAFVGVDPGTPGLLVPNHLLVALKSDRLTPFLFDITSLNSPICFST